MGHLGGRDRCAPGCLLTSVLDTCRKVLGTRVGLSCGLSTCLLLLYNTANTTEHHLPRGRRFISAFVFMDASTVKSLAQSHTAKRQGRWDWNPCFSDGRTCFLSHCSKPQCPCNSSLLSSVKLPR